MNDKKVLAVVPARGGSKGIPNKNIVDIGGNPLIKYTIDAALGSAMLTNCVISTDSDVIADVAKSCGALVPFKRPEYLSDDRAQSLPVMQHAVEFMEVEQGYQYDLVIMLQPTTPLRETKDIDNAINLLLDTGANSVISVVEVEGHHPLRMKRVVDGHLINYIDQGHEDMRPRQELPPVYIRNGAIYATMRNTLMEENSFVGVDSRAYIMPPERSVNIDSMKDLSLAISYLGFKQ
jgi:CMP-N,N'-diacetyllegionaminic acid synthase